MSSEENFRRLGLGIIMLEEKLEELKTYAEERGSRVGQIGCHTACRRINSYSLSIKGINFIRKRNVHNYRNNMLTSRCIRQSLNMQGRNAST